MFREVDVRVDYFVECCIAIGAFERRCVEEHLVDQDAEGPPVHTAGMAIASQHFWRDVLFCANERVCSNIVSTRFCINHCQAGV